MPTPCLLYDPEPATLTISVNHHESLMVLGGLPQVSELAMVPPFMPTLTGRLPQTQVSKSSEHWICVLWDTIWSLSYSGDL